MKTFHWPLFLAGLFYFFLFPSLGAAGSLEVYISSAAWARDHGKPEEALKLWELALERNPSDGFLLNQKGWAELALERIREAKDSFSRSLKSPSDGAGLAESNFGLGMSHAMSRDWIPSAKALQWICAQNPLFYPIGAVWLARAAMKMHKSHVALLYLRQALSQDPAMVGPRNLLAGLYEKEGDKRAAYEMYRTVLEINPGDSRAREGAGRIERSAKPEDIKQWVNLKIASPLLRNSPRAPDSPALRVGLFFDSQGVQSRARRLTFASAEEIEVRAPSLEAAKGRPNEPWGASWDDASQSLEIRDSTHKLLYSGKGKVRISSTQSDSGILLREIELDKVRGPDLGDRELRGGIELIPDTSGFYVINEVGEEEYLFARVAADSPEGAPSEALKALSVVLRSDIPSMKRKVFPSGAPADICDSTFCRPYRGLVQERSEATAAVLATRGERLEPASTGGVAVSPEGDLPFKFHLHCGGVTEEGIVESSSSAASIALAEITAARTVGLERFLHQPPRGDDFCALSPVSIPAASKWIRVLEPEEIAEALGARGPLGRLEDIYIVSRGALGRASGIEWIGSEGRFKIEGEKPLEEVFKRLGIRSALFSSQPLYRHGRLAYWLVWGIGSGDGHGLCLAGALGQASLGLGYKDILARYYPGARLK